MDSRFTGGKIALVLALAGAACIVTAGYFMLPAGPHGAAASTMTGVKTLSESAMDSEGKRAEERQAAADAQRLAKEREAAQVAEKEPEALILAVGDIMLSRSVAAAIKENKGDVRWPFAQLRDMLRAPDLTFANLETPVTPGRVIKPGEMTFRTDPAALEGLSDAGVDVVSLANNHTPNFGSKGLIDTLARLDAAGIAHAGAGADIDAALTPAITKAGKLTVAWLAFNDADVVPPSYGAAKDHPGTAIMDVARVTAAVRDARTHANLVFVSMHSGHEYTTEADDHQKEFAHAAIDAGAAAVIGHHPHVVQPVEIYQGKPILYSLGNFIFDQTFSSDTMDGLTALLHVNAKGVTRVEFIPVHDPVHGQPTLANDAEYARVMKRLHLPAGTLTPATAGTGLRQGIDLPALPDGP
ncbi:MAG: hypothetical protein RLZZ324_18 [Candidatus Parcubacteria bacterium]|jgi:poly-gamma-glutamate synthesis protein (capsule biosynthesis protein)